VRLLRVAHRDQGAYAREGPIACDQLLAQCRTIAGCSDPIAESSQVASVGAHHTALVDLWVWGRRHKAAVVDSPGVGKLDLEADILGVDILDPEEDPEGGSHDLEMGSLGLGEGRLVHLHSSYQKARDHQGQHHREQHGSRLASCRRHP